MIDDDECPFEFCLASAYLRPRFNRAITAVPAVESWASGRTRLSSA